MEFHLSSFSSIYRDLESEWDERMNELAGRLSAAPTEADLTQVLRDISNNAMDFTILSLEEMVFFLQIALPRRVHYERKRKKNKLLGTSPFLKAYAELCKASLADWLKVIFNYFGRAHNIFGYVLRANFEEWEYAESELGGALIEAFQEDGFELAIQSGLGHFISNPWIRSLARCHEDRLYKITGQIKSPQQVGYLVRQFLLFILRGKKKTDCKCGWLPLRQDCKCTLDLENDWCHEYFGCLASLVIQRRTGEFDNLSGENHNNKNNNNNWTKGMVNEFIQEAASHILSGGTYNIVRGTLKLGEDSTNSKFQGRKLSETEAYGNFAGAGHLHKGCQHEACQQKKRGDCSNVSCATHCTQDGYLACGPHKFKSGREPDYVPKIPFTLEQVLEMTTKKKEPNNSTTMESKKRSREEGEEQQ